MHDQGNAALSSFQDATMTDTERPLCDCPEPCGCYAEGYAAGRDKAYSEVVAGLDGPLHAQGPLHTENCACQPRQANRACLQRLLTLMATSSPALYEMVEAWALQDHDARD